MKEKPTPKNLISLGYKHTIIFCDDKHCPEIAIHKNNKSFAVFDSKNPDTAVFFSKKDMNTLLRGLIELQENKKF